MKEKCFNFPKQGGNESNVVVMVHVIFDFTAT